MFSLKRNQIIITALVLMICVAGYLNWIDSRDGTVDDTDAYALTSDGEVGAIVFDSMTGQEMAIIGQDPLNGETAIESDYPEETEVEVDNTESEPGDAVFVNASSDSSFFVQAKLSKEQDRSKQKDTLNGLIGSEEVDMGTKALCAEFILEMTERMENESAAESALVAKGFGESYVRVDDEWVEVIINKNSITEQELAQLEDIVTRHTGYTVSQIRLSSAKAQ